MSMHTITIIACFFVLSLGLSGCMSSLETRNPAQPPEARNPAQPLVGFADVHNHQFAYLGFGGLAVVGEAFSPDALIEHALSADTDIAIHGLGHIGDPLALVDGPEAGRRLILNSGY